MGLTTTQDQGAAAAGASTVCVSGPVSGVFSLSGNAGVSGFVTVSGSVGVNQGAASSVAWPFFTSQPISGNVAVSGAVSGIFSISGAVAVNQGAASSVAWPVFTSQAVSGIMSVSGSVAITGNVSVSGAALVTGLVSISNTVTVTGLVSVSGAALVTGFVSTSGTVVVSGTANQGAASSTAWPFWQWAAATASATTGFRSAGVSNTPIAVKASQAYVWSFQLGNPNTLQGFVQVYNLPAASVTVGTTAPWKTIAVPSSGTVIIEGAVPKFAISGLAVAATVSASGSTAGSGPLVVNVDYV